MLVRFGARCTHLSWLVLPGWWSAVDKAHLTAASVLYRFRLRLVSPTMDKEATEVSRGNSDVKGMEARLSCTKCFDALWFCYSPFHQMQQYYRYGEFDNCFGKWNALVDCLSLKTKKSTEIQEILEAREKAKPHIWTYRTVEEASLNWWAMYGHIFKKPES